MTSRLLVGIASVGLLFAQRNVVSLSAPLTETIYAVGARERLAGVTDSSVLPERVMADRRAGTVRMLGAFTHPDEEAIVGMRPAVVLTSTEFQRSLAERLRRRGLRVLHFEPHAIDDIFRQTAEIATAVGRQKQGSALVAAMRTEFAETTRRSASLPRVRVYVEINHEGPWTVGAESTMEEMIRAAGGANIFADRDEDTFVTSNEEIVRRNPEVVLSPIWKDAEVGGIRGITTLFEIMSRPGYASTAAVRDSRVSYYDSALFKWNGPRQALALRKLAHLIHPEAFSDPPGTIAWELGRVEP